MKPLTHFQQEKFEKGQILVIVAFVLLGLLAIIGLAVDTGIMYLSYARMCRAVDAAALGATNEFKEGYNIGKLKGAANQFLKMNGLDLDAVTVFIETCDTVNNEDDPLCKEPRAKLVRVTVKETVRLYVLPIVGIETIPVTCTATSEAASLDVVLTIDVSDSMTYGDTNNVVPKGSPMRDAKLCNESDSGGSDGFPGDCHPFQEVKEAAYAFVEQAMYAPYDRVAVVTFDKRAKLRLRLGAVPGITKPTGPQMKSAVLDVIKNLEVYEGYSGAGTGGCPYYRVLPAWPLNTPVLGVGEPCRLYDSAGGPYYNFDCPENNFNMASGNPSDCGSTNIGGGLLLAGNEFAGHKDAPVTLTREEALWVVILLTDGAANAGTDKNGVSICPNYTWDRNPYCRDTDADNVTGRHPDSVPSLYDADDYARDMADFVAKDDTGTVKGQNALIFTIGLGDLVTEIKYGNPPPGETFLKYAALFANENNKGEYYFAPTGAKLNAIFLAIANKIATRLTK